MKSSSENLQPTDAEGKYPHLLLRPKREEASARTFAARRYLPAYEYVALVKNESIACSEIVVVVDAVFICDAKFNVYKASVT